MANDKEFEVLASEDLLQTPGSDHDLAESVRRESQLEPALRT